MNLHEYQAKEILKQYGLFILPSFTVSSEEELDKNLEGFEASRFVVKAQIHAGGRGKAGGVKITDDKSQVKSLVRNMIHKPLVTHQTDAQGQVVHQVLVEAACDIEKEYYLACLLDRSSGKFCFMASREGGMDIEEVAEKSPEKIHKIFLDPWQGLDKEQALKMAENLEIPKAAQDQAVTTFISLSKIFLDKDCSLLEINPLVLTQDQKILCLDCKMSIDENSLFRHSDLEEMRDFKQEDEMEALASKEDLSFVKLDGNIGCLVNGAGLAMATMDAIQIYGGKPANFLDVGGGAEQAKIEKALEIILKDSHVKGILVCIFGGIMKCDVIARALASVARRHSLDIPIVVRFQGTNSKEGKKILQESSLNYEISENLKEAAEKIIKLTKGS